ncbi:hypothetical protein [Isobaculum melis]|uniref:Uncharacterized protein n=1 Tax=Isobaculum melis TaxID=142588 RepID=A0A1H9RW03_9LACT|nr:hypothetical protein [Isobaculum melis]SER76605.1 hypothetical protein SAMN04488559_105105 [Isobaculum melis]
MAKEVSGLKLYFRNDETWHIEKKYIGDLWIKHITTSIGRIGDSDIQEIHPCESLRVQIHPEADSVKSIDINTGGLEMGMFDRVNKYPDIEKMDILYTTNEADRIYFPYLPKDEDGIYNKFQSSVISEDNYLYLTIDPNKSVHDIYDADFIQNKGSVYFTTID